MHVGHAAQRASTANAHRFSIPSLSQLPERQPAPRGPVASHLGAQRQSPVVHRAVLAHATADIPADVRSGSAELLRSENGAGAAGPTLLESQDGCEDYGLEIEDWGKSALSIVVVGASGDLARKKIFPALFALYHEKMLPDSFSIVGYSRSKMSNEEFRDLISENLTCRISGGEDCGREMEDYLERCHYVAGQYSSDKDFSSLNDRLDELEARRKKADRIFYLSIPPTIFTDVAASASRSASSKTGWTRVIVEKPFGRDSASFRKLSDDLYEHLSEDQIYRIDHYLGKELIENLTVLRFANLLFEPLWNRKYIRNVQVIFSENFGTEGRGGYFDQYGIIRDVIQNHLLQILALFAMEPPVSLDAEDIRNEKVKVLRSMKEVALDDVVVGQYGRRGNLPSYQDDKTVPNGSLCPTFSAVAMFINNARWDGVPFLLKAGKALHSKRAEIRVQFRHVPGNLYRSKMGSDRDATTNELVIRIQPNESIYLKISNKVPGLGLTLDTQRLDLSYDQTYKTHLPDAYERLILDCINGDRRLFIRQDELEAAWALFTPVLDDLEETRKRPEPYPYGSRGPIGAHYLASKYKVRWGDLDGEDD